MLNSSEPSTPKAPPRKPVPLVHGLVQALQDDLRGATRQSRICCAQGLGSRGLGFRLQGFRRSRSNNPGEAFRGLGFRGSGGPFSGRCTGTNVRAHAHSRLVCTYPDNSVQIDATALMYTTGSRMCSLADMHADQRLWVHLCSLKCTSSKYETYKQSLFRRATAANLPSQLLTYTPL